MPRKSALDVRAIAMAISGSRISCSSTRSAFFLFFFNDVEP